MAFCPKPEQNRGDWALHPQHGGLLVATKSVRSSPLAPAKSLSHCGGSRYPRNP